MSASDFEKGSPNEKLTFSFTELPADPDAHLSDAEKAEVVGHKTQFTRPKTDLI